MRKCSLLLVLVLLMCLNSCRNKNDYLVTKSGLYYRFYQINNNNSQPKAGDVINVEMDYAYRDSILFSSVGNVNDLRIILKEHNNDGSIHEGLAMMHVGDSASFLISPKAAYSLLGDKSLPDGIADNDKIRMDIKLINFLTREQFDEELKQIHQEKVYNAQKLVNEYVVNNGINDIPTSSGLYFHEIREGHGINPTDGEKVKIHYVAKYINNVVFDDSSDTIVEFVLGKNQIFSGMEEGLKMMRKGGKATLVIPYDLAFGEEGNRLVPAFMPLVVDVELVDIVDAETVKNQEEKQAVQMIAKSREQFEKYVKDNKLEKNLIGNNLAYVTIAGGNGQIPMAGSKVKVHYVAKLIDGTVFDSSYDRNQPFEFVLGKGNVLLGWDMAVSRMAKGEKALCVMSQEVAYRDYSLGVIKPYSNLIYEIELIDFKN